jgi:hypothetical protein
MNDKRSTTLPLRAAGWFLLPLCAALHLLFSASISTVPPLVAGGVLAVALAAGVWLRKGQPSALFCVAATAVFAAIVGFDLFGRLFVMGYLHLVGQPQWAWPAGLGFLAAAAGLTAIHLSRQRSERIAVAEREGVLDQRAGILDRAVTRSATGWQLLVVAALIGFAGAGVSAYLLATPFLAAILFFAPPVLMLLVLPPALARTIGFVLVWRARQRQTGVTYKAPPLV